MVNTTIIIIAPNIKGGGGRELLEYLLEYLEDKYKDIKVIPIKSTRDNFKNQKYNLKLKSLKVIVYEYLSILYNYLKGNIL